MPTEWGKKLDKKNTVGKNPNTTQCLFFVDTYMLCIYIYEWEKNEIIWKKRKCMNRIVNSGMHYKMPQCNEQVCGGEC